MEKQLPYSSDSLNKYVPYILQILQKNGYKFPDHETFRNKVLTYYSIDIDTCKYADYIVGRERKDKKDFTECIFINERFVSTYETWEWFDTIVYKDGTPPKAEDKYLVNYNKLIFNNDTTAMLKMISTDSLSLFTIVANTGFYLNEMMVKNAINSIQSFSEKEQTTAILFDQSKPEHHKIRLDILKKLAECKPEIIFSLCFTFPKDYKEFGLYNLTISETSEIMGNILEEDILCKMKQDGDKNAYIYSDVNIYIDKNPDYISTLKNNNYYFLPNLKDAALNYIPQQQRDAGSDLVFGRIIDNDGYTNLRLSANDTSKIIIKIHSGTRVEVIGYQNKWINIKTTDGHRGYIYESHFKTE